MARPEELTKWQQGLQSRLPLLGRLRRKWAIDALENRHNDDDVVPLLVEALDLPDRDLVERTQAALAALTTPVAIDAFCELWAKKRDERLGTLIAQRKYVARTPPRLRALSGLKAGAVEVLAQGDGALVGEVLAALEDADSAVKANALRVLNTLSNPQGIDALCELWAKKRDERLWAIIAQKGYLATQPMELQILTALKGSKRLLLDRAELVPCIIALLKDQDELVRANASRSLELIQAGPAQDALCEEALKDPRGPVADLCVRTGKRPSQPERACLFLFVTRQLDAYFQEDFEFQNLRLQLQRSDPALRAQVMEVYRSSGDRRLAGLIEAERRTLGQLSEDELLLLFNSWVEHQDWPRLFQASLELPLRYSWKGFAALRQSGWEPENAELKSVYRLILADLDHDQLPESRQPSAASCLFEKWLAQGRSGDLAQARETDLLERLKTAAPPEGVAIVAALAGKAQVGSAAPQAVNKHPHWLVRLAGHATGLDRGWTWGEVNDSCYWVQELSSAMGILEIWPGQTTPADLEALGKAPPESWTGRLGSARKVLRTMMTYWNTGIHVKARVLKVHGTAIRVKKAP
jgi:hypothetical protein